MHHAHTYLAVTIGPIVKTLSKARSTKEVWAASYLFSYLMKQLVTHFEKTHTFISPVAKKDELFKPQGGAGLFPDRLIFKRNHENDFATLTQHIEQIIENLVNGKEGEEGVAPEIIDQLKIDYYTTPRGERRVVTWQGEAPSAPILDYFKKYFKIYALEVTLDDGQNVRKAIDQHLHILELQAPVMPPESVDYVAAMLRGIYGRRLEGTLLLRDGFGADYQRPFPSLLEIATSEFAHQPNATQYTARIDTWLKQTRQQTRNMIQNGEAPSDSDPDATLLNEVKILMGDAFKRRHKYIAIVQADGDGMSKVNQAIFEGRKTAEAETLLADVDARLLTFSLAAIDIIQEFGGRPIYLGGDDLLFFAPVTGYIRKSNLPAESASANEDGADDLHSVFDLVKALSASFDGQFSDSEFECLNEEGQIQKIRPTLSFGVSITYHKYPMFEALGVARHLLEAKAKGIEGKNALAFQVLKHSQQSFGTTYSKPGAVFRIHTATLLHLARKTDEAFLTSVQYVLNKQQALLCVLMAEKSKARLNHFFVNNFNEPEHSPKEGFLKTMADLLFDAFEETHDGPAAVQMAHATLRFAQFLHQPDLDDDE